MKTSVPILQISPEVEARSGSLNIGTGRIQRTDALSLRFYFTV